MKHQFITGNIAKSDATGQIRVPIYAPWRVDTQTEAILPEYLKKTAEKFAADGRLQNIKISWQTKEHRGAVKADAEIVDWFISEKGDPDFPVPGTWGASIKLNDPALISAVESGQINAVSLESEYPPKRTPLPTLVSNPIAAKGDTEPSLSGSVSPHVHSVELQFDEFARIIPTLTGISEMHRHWVTKPTAVKSENGHGHPLDLQKLETEYQDTLQIVKWLSDLSVADITLVEHAASWMPIVAMKGDSDMAGGIVQAIIVPDGVDIEMLKELLGEDYAKISIANAEKDNGSTVYVQANKADFDELNEPTEFGKTGIKVITGKPKAEKADVLTLQIVPPGEEPPVEMPDPYDVICDRNKALMQMIKGSFGQNFTADARRQIIMTSIDNFRASIDDLVTMSGDGPISDDAYKSDSGDDHPSYGVGDLASRLVAEVKKTNKQMLEEFKGIAKKAEMAITNTDETTLDDTDQAQKGDEDMSEFVTEEKLASVLEEFGKRTGLIKPEPDPKQVAEEALKADMSEQLKPLTESITALTEKLDAMKTELDESKTAAEALKADNEELKAGLDKNKETIEALQRIGTPGVQIDAFQARKADPSAAANSEWGKAFSNPGFLRTHRTQV